MRLVGKSQCDSSVQNSEFLQTGEARAAIVRTVASSDLQYVAAVDAWGFVCVWDSAQVFDAQAAGHGECKDDAVVARWKVSEGPVLDIQFTKHNGKTCVLLLLPPVAPATVNALSLFVLDSANEGEEGCIGQLAASWQPHSFDGKDCLCFVDKTACDVASVPRSSPKHADEAGEWHSGSPEDEQCSDDRSAAADLATHVNTIL